MLKAKLFVVGGDSKQSEIELRLPTVIGRGHEVDLTVPHALVSRRHTEIFEKDGRLFVRDLGSLNGTFVNNKRIDTDHPLDPDQLLTLGTVTFRANYKIVDRANETDSDFNSETTVLEQIRQSSDGTRAGKQKLQLAPPISFADQTEAPIDKSCNLETIDIDSIRPAASREVGPPEANCTEMVYDQGRVARLPRNESASPSFNDLSLADESPFSPADSELLGSFIKKLPR